MKTLVIVFVIAICSTVAFGEMQQATSTEITITSGPVTISAEEIISDSTIGSIKAFGRVRVDVDNGKFKYQADEVELTIDRNAGLITGWLRGTVRMTFPDKDGSIQTMETTRGQFNIKLP